MIIRGVDVSRAQPPPTCDWARAFDAGIRFAWVKGSEGAGGAAGAFVDPAAAQHLGLLGRTPILRGMYHVARPDNRDPSGPWREDGRAEGEHAAATAIALGVAGPGHLPVVIDLEKYTTISAEQDGDFVRGLVDTIERELGRLPIVYAGPNYWTSQHTDSFAGELRERGVLLWQVTYTPADDPTRSIPGWPWSFWQHSGGGAVAYAPPIPGLPHPVDQNIYRGTMAELRGLVESDA